jgi:hypothetical protein
MIEIHTNAGFLDNTFGAQVKRFTTLETAVNFLADFKRHLKKLGLASGRKFWFVDTNSDKNYEVPNPAKKRGDPVYVHAYIPF